MNLVISMSKMTNCHDGLRSSLAPRTREEKRLWFVVVPSSTTSDQCHFSSMYIRSKSRNNFQRCRSLFWQGSILIYHLVHRVSSSISLSINVILSHRNLISWSCHPMRQVSSVFFLFRARMKDERKKKKEQENTCMHAHKRNFIASYRRFIFLYHIANHCVLRVCVCLF